MPKNIDQARQRRDAVGGVALFAVIHLACAAGIGSLCLIPGLPKWAVWVFAALALVCVLCVFFAVGALKERFQEIQGGELDEARQY